MRGRVLIVLALVVVVGPTTPRATASAHTFGAGEDAFTIEFVPIGDPGNPPGAISKPSSAGSVSYLYRMGKHEVSRDMIQKASRAGGLNLTLADMSAYGGDHADRPATGITWIEAAAFVNWLNTSAGYQAAYDLTGGSLNLWPPGDAWQAGGENRYRHMDAHFFLPSENEWYKAAYYDGAARMYYNRPTGSDAIPQPVAAGTTAGTAVYWQPVPQGPADTSSAGGLSPYGTMGQGGNAREWVESAADGVNDSTSEERVTRGGHWYDAGAQLGSVFRLYLPDPAAEHYSLGFRVAAVPGGNEKPALVPVADAVVAPGGLLEVTLAATDPEVPPNNLSYGLVSGPPGATVEGNVFRWQTQASDAGQVHLATVQVTDDGQPPLSDQGSFRITVGADLRWEIRASGADGPLRGVAWGTDKFVAVGNGGKVLTSADGLTWDQQVSPTNRTLMGVTHGAGRFVAVGSGGVVLTSADGLTWLSGHSGSSSSLADAAYGNGGFAVVGWRLLTSDSEATYWRPGAILATMPFEDVSFGRGRFVASGTNGLVASRDYGLQWYLHDAGTTASLTASGYGFDQWWVGGAGGVLRASANLADWRVVDSGVTDPIAGLAYGDGLMLAVGGPNNGMTGGFVLVSRDGVRWERAPIGDVPTLYDVSFDGQTFVAVGEGGVVVRGTRSQGSSWGLITSVEGDGRVERTPDLGRYPDRTTVVLTAMPATGWIFTGWSGDLSGTANPASLAMTADRSVRASFFLSNRAPTLAAVDDQEIAEGEWFEWTLQATDPDLPAQALSYFLASGPAGATVDGATGVLRWQAGNADGGQVYLFSVAVTDGGTPPLSDVKAFYVSVTEANAPPVFAPEQDREVLPGETLTVQLQATDADVPPNQLAFGLEEGPAGATVGALSGQFVWTATEPLGIVTHRVRVRVSDDGTPPLSDVVEFDVRVVGLPPIVNLESPGAGATGDERAILAGTVTDNVGVAVVRWERDGEAMGVVNLTGDRFEVAGLRLHPGENRFRVVAEDHAGNSTSAEVVTRWEPLRTLAILDAAEVQEGQRTAAVPLELISGGEVGGLTFLLSYDPGYLRDPELVWDPAVAAATTTVDGTVPGELRATLSLEGRTIAAGTQRVAEVTFRTRSVPAAQVTLLTPQAVNASDPTGVGFAFGTDTVPGSVRIRPRRLLGDNNGNDRLDIGDAALVQRFLTGVEEVRIWDVSGNDLDRTEALDEGDVTRILRVVVGWDAAETAAPRVGDDPVRGMALQGDGEPDTPRLSLAPVSALGKIGEVVTYDVRLTNVTGSLAGVFFRLEYPVAALRLLGPESHVAGVLVPTWAQAVWNVSPSGDDYPAQDGVISFAASGAVPWAQAEGVLARLSFAVQGDATRAVSWPLRVAEAEGTVDGYDTLALRGGEATLEIERPQPELLPAESGITPEGFQVVFTGLPGWRFVIETTEDLQAWTSLATVPAEGNTVRVLDPVLPTSNQRFYRVRLAE